MNCDLNENLVCPTPDKYGACFNCEVLNEIGIRELDIYRAEPVYSEEKDE